MQTLLCKLIYVIFCVGGNNVQKAKIDERARKDATKQMQELEQNVADLSEIEQLKKDISLIPWEITTMKKAYEECKANFDAEHEALKVRVKKAEAEVVTQHAKVQSLEAKVLSLKKKSSSKGNVIKALEAKVEALVASAR